MRYVFSIIAPAEIILKPEDVVTSEGSLAEFYCEADGIPYPEVTWSKHNQQLIETERITVQTGGNGKCSTCILIGC